VEFLERSITNAEEVNTGNTDPSEPSITETIYQQSTSTDQSESDGEEGKTNIELKPWMLLINATKLL
jgi:hypothetical protein